MQDCKHLCQTLQTSVTCCPAYRPIIFKLKQAHCLLCASGWAWMHPLTGGCTMNTASTALQSFAPAGAAHGGVESGRGITHLGRKRSHGRGLPAQCSPGAQSGAALPAGPKHTLCMTPGQRWSAALPRLGQCTLCSHLAFLKCACSNMLP